MKFYSVAPEVAGGIGPSSVLDHSAYPPTLLSVNYEMEGWLGDELLKAMSVYIVTSRVADALRESGFTGFSFDTVEIILSEQFRSSYAESEIPNFEWLKIYGLLRRDDLGYIDARNQHLIDRSTTGNARLIASGRIVDLFRRFRVEHWTLSEIRSAS